MVGVDASSCADRSPEAGCAADVAAQPIYVFLPSRWQAFRSRLGELKRIRPVSVLAPLAIIAILFVTAWTEPWQYVAIPWAPVAWVLMFVLPVAFGWALYKLPAILNAVERGVKAVKAWNAAPRSVPPGLALESGRPLKELVEAGFKRRDLVHIEFIEHLAQADCAGNVVCVLREPQRPPDALYPPLAVPFEPMSLDEASADALASAESAAPRDQLGLTSRPDDSTDVGRRVRRAWRLGVLRWSALVFVVCLGFLLTSICLRGSVSCANVLILVAALVAWVLGVVSAWCGNGAYIISGGLLDPKGKRIFRRQTGLLIWRADAHLLHVTNKLRKDVLTLNVTRDEALLALRAWLSPVPGPSDELIESFLKGRG